MFANMSRLFIACMMIGFMISGMACAEKSQPDQAADAMSMPQQGQTSDAVAKSQPSTLSGNAAGVWWSVPGRWSAQAERPMRIATYAVPAAPGDQEDGECAFFFFGTGEGGDIKANVARWQAQFEGVDGKPAALNEQKAMIKGFSVTTVSVAGAYLSSMGPMFQAGAVKKPGYRMLGAIIEAPEGNVFIKFTGPEKTVAAAEKEFQGMLESLRK